MTHPTAPLDPTTVERAMDAQRDEWLDVLSTFVSIPSENPPGDTTAVADSLTDLLDDRGIPYEVVAPRESMPTVVAQFDGDLGDPSVGRHLTFNGHLDTFPRRDEDRWERDPFSGAVTDGKVHGRGTSDMHGGFTASLAAFCYLFEHRDAFQGRVTLAAVSDEETGGTWGTEYLVEHHPEYTGDVVISGEPSSNGIVRFGERGRVWTELVARGESAHTCSVPRGLNAIEDLIGLLADVKRLPARADLVDVPADARETILAAEAQMDAAYGEGATARILEPRVNVGTIEGGEKVNLVAEHARAEVDIRLPLGTSTQQALDHVAELAAEYEATVTVDGFSRKDPTYSDPHHPIFDLLQRFAGEVRDGAEPALSCALAGTDCAFYRERGVPCAVYGPSPHNLGSQNEYITIADFEQVLKAQAMASAAYLSTTD
jgi:succinyl-diaminopimelate desuccinylase